jgi:hypothetical protein
LFHSVIISSLTTSVSDLGALEKVDRFMVWYSLRCRMEVTSVQQLMALIF